MSILNSLKDFFIPAEGEYENSENYAPETSAGDASGDASGSRRESFSAQYEERKAAASATTSSRSAARNGSPTLQVILVKPTEFADAKKIADHLMNHKTVVLVLEEASDATRRRVIDFLVGVAYAQDGNLKPIANQTYIVTPHDVGLVDLVSELESNGYRLNNEAGML